MSAPPSQLVRHLTALQALFAQYVESSLQFHLRAIPDLLVFLPIALSLVDLSLRVYIGSRIPVGFPKKPSKSSDGREFVAPSSASLSSSTSSRSSDIGCIGPATLNNTYPRGPDSVPSIGYDYAGKPTQAVNPKAMGIL
ncbi:hypothetical protein Tsubulata_048875 [Turnera subulata]|uniref:Uncharacterized protein n=1 Tax=Turnera subulata TaxID=218843 RepID=A0A9Q0JBD9_9ROSI|nr:hypothetical protein Tsubulata_048875 [Turnera subulata]